MIETSLKTEIFKVILLLKARLGFNTKKVANTFAFSNRIRSLFLPWRFLVHSHFNFFKGICLLLLFLCCPSLYASNQGQNKDPIQVSPQRITLGALSYGSKQGTLLERKIALSYTAAREPFVLTKVDVSRAPGIRLKQQIQSLHKIELIFEIDTTALTHQQPFGKFVKVPIRLETNQSDFSQVIIPLVAWLSINETKRDFSDYRFQGNLRWQGPWSTPNIAGAVLAPAVLLILGLMAATSQCLSKGQGNAQANGSSLKKGLRGLTLFGLIVLMSIVLSLLYLLAHTYSRGSWVALLPGLALLMLGKGTLRWLSLATASFFLIIIGTLPSGVDRVESYTKIEEDKSIANRFRLWTGALQMMAEHPFHGVGADGFETRFKRDYQAFEHKAENSTAVSDFMTFGAERGLPFLALSCGLLLMLLFESLRGRKIISLTLGSMLASIMTASSFSTLWFIRDYQWLFFISVGGLICVLVKNLWACSPRKTGIKKLLVKTSLFVLSSLIGLSFVSWLFLNQLPTRSLSSPQYMPDFSGTLTVEPRQQAILGTVLYLTENKEADTWLAHSTLRPLAAKGWRVVWPGSLEKRDQAEQVFAHIRERYPDEPLHVAGHGQGGKLALDLAAQKNLAGAGCSFLTGSSENTQSITQLVRPFLVYHFLYDDQVSANAALHAEKNKPAANDLLKIMVQPEIPGRLSPAWLDWIQAMHEHFSKVDSDEN
jgi:hypothetical protein